VSFAQWMSPRPAQGDAIIGAGKDRVERKPQAAWRLVDRRDVRRANRSAHHKLIGIVVKAHRQLPWAFDASRNEYPSSRRGGLQPIDVEPANRDRFLKDCMSTQRWERAAAWEPAPLSPLYGGAWATDHIPISSVAGHILVQPQGTEIHNERQKSAAQEDNC